MIVTSLVISIIAMILNIVILLKLGKMNSNSVDYSKDFDHLKQEVNKNKEFTASIGRNLSQQHISTQQEINKLNLSLVKELHNIKSEEYKDINESISKLKDIQLDILSKNNENISKIEKSLLDSIKVLETNNEKIFKDVRENMLESVKTNNEFVEKLKSENGKQLKDIKDNISEILKSNNKEVSQRLSDMKSLNEESLKSIQSSNTQSQKENIEKLDNMQLQILEKIKDNQSQLYKDNSDNIEKLQQTLQDKLSEIKDSNEKKLNDIQDNVNKKLDTSLNERLDSSFKQVGDQLQSLYRSIGELQSLSSGVTDLQKTLSNVKTRGIFGETQLRNIITEVLDKSQFSENVSTKHNLDFVEFAVKIPDKENYKKFIYLPIDSKFPGDIYSRIVEASNEANKDELNKAVKEFEARIKQEAKTISDKYINTPETTDFAIMFLPTEGLYSEAVKINGLMDYCQSKHKVIICGPSTLVALLNSLSIGFKYLTINKNSEDILKMLSSIKVQYEKFRDLILKTQKKLTEAQNLTGDLQHRNELIHKKLYRVDSIEQSEAERILELENIIDVDDF